MKQLTCEMCGSTELVKQDGFFVCQTCGCKYSVEEAKKMMIEGTVEVTGSVKVDDTSKIENYFTMAENAYYAGNMQESELYCNKIIEIDHSNYNAWFVKAKAAGWQSTLANVRIEETESCFIKAIDNAPEEKKDDIIENAIYEFSNLLTALMRKGCDLFEKYPTEETKKDIITNLRSTIINLTKLTNKCDDIHHREAYLMKYRERIATMLTDSVWNAWVEVITKDYNHADHPGAFAFEQFIFRCISCQSLLKEAILLSEDEQENIQRYKKRIAIISAHKESGMYKASGSSYRFGGFDDDYKKGLVDEIMECHKKIKELDPSYEVPQPSTQQSQQSQNSGGCYVATCVYGSYDCPEVWTLRRYRDDTLGSTWYGRLFIRTYYAISPTLVKWFGHTEWFKKMWKGKLDRMVANLNAEGVKDTPYEDKIW